MEALEKERGMTTDYAPLTRTYRVAEFAKLLGVSRAFAYEQAKTGAIAGVPVIVVGRRLLVPRAPADRLLAGEPATAAGALPDAEQAVEA